MKTPERERLNEAERKREERDDRRRGRGITTEIETVRRREKRK